MKIETSSYEASVKLSELRLRTRVAQPSVGSAIRAVLVRCVLTRLAMRKDLVLAALDEALLKAAKKAGVTKFG